MCGRFTLAERLERIKERFQIREISYEYSPNYNVAPSQIITAVVHTNRGNILVPLKWGFTIRKGITAINARDDKISTITTFEKSFRFSRCLILADGFYEWKKTGGTRKIPNYIRLKSKEVFGFAGIFRELRNSNGTLFKNGAIITTSPNTLLKNIHNRMPVIIPQDKEQEWLDDRNQNLDLLKLLIPYPSELMEAFNVSNKVGNVKYNGPELIEPKISLNRFF